MKTIDVTVTMRHDMPGWPGEPTLSIKPHSRIARHQPANVSVVTCGDHSGTHVDPPVHFVEGGATVDQLRLETLLGPCRVVAYDGADHVSGAWLDGQRLDGVTRLLIKTRNSEWWAKDDRKFHQDFIALQESAARWCIDHGIQLIGIDYLSIEPFGSEAEGYPVHHGLLRMGIVIVEGLDLHDVAPGDYELLCLPTKIGGGDGAPARVVLRG